MDKSSMITTMTE